MHVNRLRCPKGHRNLRRMKYRLRTIPESERRPNGPKRRKLKWDGYYCNSCGAYYTTSEMISTHDDPTLPMKSIRRRRWDVRCPKGHVQVDPRRYRRINGRTVRWTGWYCRTCAEWYEDDEVRKYESPDSM